MKTLKQLKSPKKIDAGFTADFFCKYHNHEHEADEFPYTVEAMSWGEAINKARTVGWIVHRDHTATCPKCAAAMRESPEERSFRPVLAAMDEKLPEILAKHSRSPKAREAIQDIAAALREAMAARTH